MKLSEEPWPLAGAFWHMEKELARTKGQYDFGFDLDDVLFPCAEPLIEACKEAGWIPEDFTLEDLERSRLHEQFGWEEYREGEFLTPDFFRDQEPFPEVLNAILSWKRMDARTCFITARREPAEQATKEVMQSLGFSPGCVFFSPTEKKHLIAQELGLLLFVDDRPDSSLNMAGVIPYSFNMPYRFNEYIDREIKAKKISNLYREDWQTTEGLITGKGIHHSVFNTLEKYVEQEA